MFEHHSEGASRNPSPAFDTLNIIGGYGFRGGYDYAFWFG